MSETNLKFEVDTKFNADLLRQPTSKTLLFISKSERNPVTFKCDNGKIRSITSDFAHDQLAKWKSGKYWIFIWKERVHDKKGPVEARIYYDHLFYRYFLVPAGKKIIPLVSKAQYDFGFHRVKPALETEGAILLLTITDEDISGYTR